MLSLKGRTQCFAESKLICDHLWLKKPVTYCLIVTTYEKEVDNFKLVEAASQFWFKNEHRFSIKE